MKPLSLLVVIFFSFTAFASDPFLPFAEEAVGYGLVKYRHTSGGYETGRNLMRQEAVGMALSMAGPNFPADYVCRDFFSDVSFHTPNYWACRVIENAVDKRLVSTENDTFRPTENATRAEVLAMFFRGAGVKLTTNISKYTYDADTKNWEKYVIASGKHYGIITTTDPFRPHDPITRGEAFVMGVNIMKLVSD